MQALVLFFCKIDVFPADRRLYARGRLQAGWLALAVLGAAAGAGVGAPPGWLALAELGAGTLVGAVAELGAAAGAGVGAPAGWLALAELGAGRLVGAAVDHVTIMPFGPFCCQENSGCRSTHGRSWVGKSNLLRREYMRSSCGPRPRAL